MSKKKKKCPKCNGTGETRSSTLQLITGNPYGSECNRCHGTGYIKKGKHD